MRHPNVTPTNRRRCCGSLPRTTAQTHSLERETFTLVVDAVHDAGELDEGIGRGCVAAHGRCEAQPGHESPSHVLVKVRVVERRRGLDRVDQLTLRDRIGHRRRRADAARREAEAIEELDERSRGNLETICNREALPIKRFDDGGNGLSRAVSIETELAAAGLDPACVANHSVRMHERIDVGQVHFQYRPGLEELAWQQDLETCMTVVDRVSGQSAHRGSGQQKQRTAAGPVTRLICDAVVS